MYSIISRHVLMYRRKIHSISYFEGSWSICSRLNFLSWICWKSFISLSCLQMRLEISLVWSDCLSDILPSNFRPLFRGWLWLWYHLPQMLAHPRYLLGNRIMRDIFSFWPVIWEKNGRLWIKIQTDFYFKKG